MTEQPDLPSRPPAAGLLIAGTSSDAGKSLLVTALCRAYARRGVRVAPFKAQNMSNNSMVCTDGSEIGRAQYAQARAAGVEPSSLHNPVLLKPGSDRTAHVVVRGQPAGILRAGEYATGRRHLAQAAFAAYGELAQQSDLIICEGAGSPAEINLRTGDYVNLGLAREFGLPVVVVGDIDRGGILAALYGTWALLDDGDRSLLRGFVINKFRGDRSVLEPGLTEITRRTGIPFLGVLPWLEQVWIDSEDNLAPPSSMIRSASMISSADHDQIADHDRLDGRGHPAGRGRPVASDLQRDRRRCAGRRARSERHRDHHSGHGPIRRSGRATGHPSHRE